jgi:hypothetical protein
MRLAVAVFLALTACSKGTRLESLPADTELTLRFAWEPGMRAVHTYTLDKHRGLASGAEKGLRVSVRDEIIVEEHPEGLAIRKTRGEVFEASSEGGDPRPPGFPSREEIAGMLGSVPVTRVTTTDGHLVRSEGFEEMTVMVEELFGELMRDLEQRGDAGPLMEPMRDFLDLVLVQFTPEVLAAREQTAHDTMFGEMNGRRVVPGEEHTWTTTLQLDLAKPVRYEAEFSERVRGPVLCAADHTVARCVEIERIMVPEAESYGAALLEAVLPLFRALPLPEGMGFEPSIDSWMTRETLVRIVEVETLRPWSAHKQATQSFQLTFPSLEMSHDHERTVIEEETWVWEGGPR